MLKKMISLAFLLTSACATALTPGGMRVSADPNADTRGCQFVANMTGTSWAGMTPEGRIESALNDLRNKASQAGANYVRPGPAQTMTQNGNTSSVSVTGAVYKCPQ